MHTIKVRGVILLENKIFLVRDINKHFYYLPWWTLEKDETFKECLKREIYEELWLIPEIWDLISMREFQTDSGIYLDVWFNIENNKDFLYINKEKATHSFEYYDEWFYDFAEMIWKDMRPNNLEDILYNKNKINIL